MSEILDALLADGNSSIEKSLRVRKQPRDKRGRWVATGASLSADIDGKGKVKGKAIGGTAEREGEQNNIRMLVGTGYEDQGIAANTVLEVNPKNGELETGITLDREYLQSKGIDPDKTADLPDDLANQPQKLEDMNPQPADDLDIDLATNGLTDDEDAQQRSAREEEPVAKLSPAVAEQQLSQSELRDVLEFAKPNNADGSRIGQQIDGSSPEIAAENTRKLKEQRRLETQLGRSLTKDEKNALNLNPLDASYNRFNGMTEYVFYVDDGSNPEFAAIRDREALALKNLKAELAGNKPNSQEALTDGAAEDMMSAESKNEELPNIDEIIKNISTNIDKAPEPDPLVKRTPDSINTGDVVRAPNGRDYTVLNVTGAPKDEKTGALNAKLTLQDGDGNVIESIVPLDREIDVVKGKKGKPIKPAAKPGEKQIGEKPEPKDESVTIPGPTTQAPEETPPLTFEQNPDIADDGELIDRPEGIDDASVRAKFGKIPVITKDGKAVWVYKEDGTRVPAQDGDAVLAQILDKFPNAKVNSKGEVILERRDVVDNDGVTRRYTTKIARNNNGGYIVGFEIQEPDGSVQELWHYDQRDSLEAVFGKKNGPLRLGDILSGEAMPKESKLDLKTYFQKGGLAARLRFLNAGKLRRIDESKLQKDLDKARALPEGNKKRQAEIARAEYHLEKFNNEFNGDPELYTEWYKTQVANFLTIDQLIDKYSSGGAVKYNYADGAQLGNVLTSSRESLYDALAKGDWETVSQMLLQLGSNLPTWARNPEIAQKILDKIRANYKKRYPEMNQRQLSAWMSTAFNAMWASSDEASYEKPQTSFDGKVLREGMIVEALSNDDKPSIGRIRRMSRVTTGKDGQNMYVDYMFIEFVDKNGNVTSGSVEIPAKSVRFISEGDGGTGDLDLMTPYNPKITGAQKVKKRLGIELDEDGLPMGTNKIAFPEENESDSSVGGNIDDADVGSSFVGKDGSVKGTIVSKTSATNKAGDEVWAIVYQEPDGDLKRASVKKGEVRDPK